jgi:hypothetical protein
MSFLRHGEAYRSDVAGAALGATTVVVTPSSGSSASMSVPIGYSLAGCSPAVPASASPTIDHSQQPTLPYNDFSANGNNPLNSVSQPKGAVQ